MDRGKEATTGWEGQEAEKKSMVDEPQQHPPSSSSMPSLEKLLLNKLPRLPQRKSRPGKKCRPTGERERGREGEREREIERERERENARERERERGREGEGEREREREGQQERDI